MSADSVSALLQAAPAPERERAHGRDPAPEHEAGHPGPDDHLTVGDGGAWRASRWRGLPPAGASRAKSPAARDSARSRPGSRWACGWECGRPASVPLRLVVTVSRIFLASSIAIVGVGAPTFSLRQANRNAAIVSSSSRTSVIRKPFPQAGERRVQTPGQREQGEHHREDPKHGAGRYRGRAAGEARRLGGDLGLGQLDLLAHQHADALGDLGHRRGDVVGLSVSIGQGA